MVLQKVSEFTSMPQVGTNDFSLSVNGGKMGSHQFVYLAPTITAGTPSGGSPRQPGFEAVFAIVGLLAAAYLTSRRGRKGGA